MCFSGLTLTGVATCCCSASFRRADLHHADRVDFLLGAGVINGIGHIGAIATGRPKMAAQHRAAGI